MKRGRPKKTDWEKWRLDGRAKNALMKAHIYNQESLRGVIERGEKIDDLGPKGVEELNKYLKGWKIGCNSNATKLWIIDCTTKRPILDKATYWRTLEELAKAKGLNSVTALSEYLADTVGKPFHYSFLGNSKRDDTGNRGLTPWEVHLMRKVIDLPYDPTEATGIFAQDPEEDEEQTETVQEAEEHEDPADLADQIARGIKIALDDVQNRNTLRGIIASGIVAALEAQKGAKA